MSVTKMGRIANTFELSKRRFEMSKPIYMMFRIRPTEAYWQLSEEEQASFWGSVFDGASRGEFDADRWARDSARWWALLASSSSVTSPRLPNRP